MTCWEPEQTWHEYPTKLRDQSLCHEPRHIQNDFRGQVQTQTTSDFNLELPTNFRSLFRSSRRTSSRLPMSDLSFSRQDDPWTRPSLETYAPVWIKTGQNASSQNASNLASISDLLVNLDIFIFKYININIYIWAVFPTLTISKIGILWYSCFPTFTRSVELWSYISRQEASASPPGSLG